MECEILNCSFFLKILLTIFSHKLCFIGLPCAGYLATELLRRLYADRVQQSTSLGDPFARAELIQDLTLFSSYLSNYYDPTDRCYEIAQKGSKAIRSAINRVLSPDESQVPQENLESAFENTDLPDHTRISMDDGMNFMAWLDTIDWGQQVVWN